MSKEDWIKSSLNSLGKGKVILAPRTPQQDVTEAKSLLHIQVREKTTREAKEIDPRFTIGEKIPPAPIGKSLPDYENPTVHGYKVHDISGTEQNGDIVRIEYIGHADYEKILNGESRREHVFCFKSWIRKPNGDVTSSTFYPSAPNEHSKSKGGNMAFNIWFRKIRELETENKNVEDPKWLPKTKNGDFSYTCIV